MHNACLHEVYSQLKSVLDVQFRRQSARGDTDQNKLQQLTACPAFSIGKPLTTFFTVFGFFVKRRFTGIEAFPEWRIK
jgi:hypothetical protein